jgi:hypothetical protein
MTAQKTRHVATTKKWDAYVAEASKPDFVIEVPGEDDIVIHNPTGEQAERARHMDQQGELSEALEAICGEDAAGRLMPMLMNAPAGVIGALTDDIMKHFVGDQADQGNSPASSR